eukprot:672025-Pleurochrysis_carterae.AAC.1
MGEQKAKGARGADRGSVGGAFGVGGGNNDWRGGRCMLITYQVREGKCVCQSHFLQGHGPGRPERVGSGTCEITWSA